MISKNITYYRKKCNLSQNDIAKALFVTPQAVSRWEKGITEPNIDTISKLANLFKISIEELIYGPKAIKITTNFHRVYFHSSIFMIGLTILFVLNEILGILPWLKWVFLAISLMFLLFIMISEIYLSKIKK